MQTKSSSSLEVKLESLKDQLLLELRETKLLVNPKINDLTLTYEQRRGLETKGYCKIIQTGLKIMLNRAYNGEVDLHFETVEEQSREYKVTLEVLAETKQAEQQRVYESLTKIIQFIKSYKTIKK